MVQKRATTRVDLVTRALYLLNGDSCLVDTEDVASKAYELDPGAFRWRTRPDQINLELVRVALSDAKKASVGWVNGTGRTGWSLTAAGRERAVSLATLFPESREKEPPVRTGVGRGIDDSRRHIERGRLQSTEAWKKWTKGDWQITSRQAEEVFRIDTYSTGRIRNMKINRLVALFEQQEDIQDFLTQMISALR